MPEKMIGYVLAELRFELGDRQGGSKIEPNREEGFEHKDRGHQKCYIDRLHFSQQNITNNRNGYW